VSGSNTEDGWTAGAGIEYAISNNWSVKVEYLYYELGTESAKSAIPNANNFPGARGTSFAPV